MPEIDLGAMQSEPVLGIGGEGLGYELFALVVAAGSVGHGRQTDAHVGGIEYRARFEEVVQAVAIVQIGLVDVIASLGEKAHGLEADTRPIAESGALEILLAGPQRGLRRVEPVQ